MKRIKLEQRLPFSNSSPEVRGKIVPTRRLYENNSAKALTTNQFDFISFIWSEWRRQKFPLWIFLGLCLNLIVAPAVYAATPNIERTTAYALGVLGLVTLGLGIYLFTVILQPEHF
jgi:K+-transporting ATPase KdpF subunit